MFRNRKDSQADKNPVPPASPVEDEIEIDAIKSPPRRPLPTPVRAATANSLPYETARRPVETPATLGRMAPAPATVREKTLVVGRDVHIKGDILSCERMIVEGRVELTVHLCQHIQIGESGLFRGTFDVAEADIAGDFEGELTVRERLTVRASGKVRGRIRYRHIVIEAGGLIIGDVDELEHAGSGEEAPRSVQSPAGPEPAGASVA
jgi:cytoskeletal protein CcmA (bactofilin family)